ncbi:hypothetical protein ACQCSX_00255 [Pseudarthrobacter sp. P1]|uniref:hypothetical protein n=1 Tax=Pseudarthrobacter sp. P1 TaxID=3418418 RepID=UPI003CEF3C60
MTENPGTPVPSSSDAPVPAAPRGPGHRPAWLNRGIGIAAVVVALVLAYLIASIALPVMWAHTIGTQVQSNAGSAIGLGIFYGFVFAFLPVVMGWQARYKGMKRWLRISILVVAVLLAVPNLLTLGILNGTNNAAHDAQRILSVEATWFSSWSVWFMVVGVLAGVGAILAVPLWRRRGQRIRAYKVAEKAQRKAAEAAYKAAAQQTREAEKAATKAARNAERGKQP